MLYRQLQSATGVVQDRWEYGYDALSNLTQSLRRYPSSGGTLVRSETYRYDPKQRLLSATRSDGLGTTTTDYAANGNLLAKSDYASNYQYTGNGPHAVKQATAVNGLALTYAYDANGNLTGGNTLSAFYDHDNRPWYVARLGSNGTTLLGSDRFMYGADGERFYHQDSQGTVTYYAAGGYQRVQKDGQVEHRHALPGLILTLKGGSGSLDLTTATRILSYHHSDRLGSTTALSNSAGGIVDRRSYDPFGQARNGDFSNRSNGTLGLDPPETRGFTAHEHLDRTYLIHMNGRTYDYRLGRFLAVDPLIQFPTNSQSLNPYSYLLNNPLAGTDPSGFAGRDVDQRSICFKSPSACDSNGNVSSAGSGSPGPSGRPNNGARRNGASRAQKASPGAAADIDKPANTTLASADRENAPGQPDGNALPGDIPILQHIDVRPTAEERRKLFEEDFQAFRRANNEFFFTTFLGPLGAAVVDAPRAIRDPSPANIFFLALDLTGAAELRAAQGVARGGLTAVRIGQAGEDAVRAAFDIGPKKFLIINGRGRIPDGLTADVLSEVKNVRSLSFTRQLRDFANFAEQKGLRFDLFVRPGARLSQPLLDARAAGRVNIREIP